ncbi:homoserine O-acetyltransferase family protein [Ekhidna sp.]|uniref:homoserine O-acetyltransferase family protein n=1 Tax=Ekhidna sp. TaxID=2608089 RepID=UPI003B5C9189
MQTLQASKSFGYKVEEPLVLECGVTLRDLRIQYTTWGKLNSDKSNVVWVFHALTANSDPSEWWENLFTADSPISPTKDFIICANTIGSCYGGTEPKDYDFPLITVRDIVEGHKCLKKYLGFDKIKLGIGGSLGGQQLLEWAVQEPGLFEVIVPLATNAKHSAWGIAFNEAQRMALKNVDKNQGLEAARAIAMLSYRNYQTFEQTQTDTDHRIDHYSASSYQNYQGEKLRKRFSPISYYYLSKTMDSHDVGRHYKGVDNALKRIKSKVISIGITSDILFPTAEQKLIAERTPDGVFYAIESLYGHDGFLLETKQINQILKKELT